MRGNSAQLHRRSHGKKEPEPFGECPCGSRCRFFRGWKAVSSWFGLACKDGAENCINDKADRPEGALDLEREIRFDDDGVRDQGEERPRVGEGEEPVGNTAALRSQKPQLQQRAGSTEKKERKSDRQSQC